MSLKRKNLGFEALGSCPQKELYDALYATGNSAHYWKAQDIFNKPFDLKALLDGFESRLGDILEHFTERTRFGLIDGYIHVIAMGNVVKSCGIRRYHKLQEEHIRTIDNCIFHSGSSCRIVDHHVGFLLYLSWVDLLSSIEEEAKGDQKAIEEQSAVDSLEDQRELEDLSEAIGDIEEPDLKGDLNIELFKAETITKVESDRGIPKMKMHPFNVYLFFQHIW